MTSPAERASSALHALVRSEIENVGPTSIQRFDELAIAIAMYQAEHVEVFRRLTAARGLDLSLVCTSDEIPAVPTDVFRMRRVAAHPPELDVRTFRTSGTTHGQRGAHHFRDLGTYESAALVWGRRMLWRNEPPDRVIVLAPSSRELPDSSLSFMIDLFATSLAVPTTHHLGEEGLDWRGLVGAVERAREEGSRVLVFGTSFAFVFLMDGIQAGLGGNLALPPGSRAMLTGGFKGRSREVDESVLRSMLSESLAILPEDIVGEYGMTELSSQLYESSFSTHGRLYVPPPWVRVTAVDPLTLAPRPRGEEGLCRIVDLANVDSSVAIQTLDWVRVEQDGVALFGRAKGAEPRGCSLTIEEIFSGAKT